MRESTYHTLTECDKYNEARRGIWCVERLVPPFEVTGKQIYKFLKDANIPTLTNIMNYRVNQDRDLLDENAVLLRILPLHE